MYNGHHSPIPENAERTSYPDTISFLRYKLVVFIFSIFSMSGSGPPVGSSPSHLFSFFFLQRVISEY